MAVVVATVTRRPGGSRHIERFNAISAANTEITTSTIADVLAPSANRKLLSVMVAYSAAPTQTGVTVVLNSGVAVTHDTLLLTGSANARYTVYAPDGEVILLPDDEIDVVAPAGGGALTASVLIVIEQLIH